MINWRIVTVFISLFTVVSCGEQNQSASVSAQQMTDAIHVVLEADRKAYTELIVNRLVNKTKTITASEHWEADKALLLPAQMFRAGAEMANPEKGFDYALLSLWPINSQNGPKTDIEKIGLEKAKEGIAFYGNEELGGKKYFTAVYPDLAVSSACYECHNDHKDSPKKDFKLNDVMGGVIIRVPIQ